MAGKKKVESRIIEAKSLEIVRKMLPLEWEIRGINPDYGLDLSIELFEDRNKARLKDAVETLGEHIYIQVKGTEKIKKQTIKIYEEGNNETNILNDSNKALQGEMEVVSFNLDVSLLETVERMSSSIIVMLFVVDIIQNEIYFVCLNDYIDKVLIPKGEYKDCNQKTIYIPIENCISEKNKNNGINVLKFYSQRAKMYSFFLKVQYQNIKLRNRSAGEIKKLYKHFACKLLNLDIWNREVRWTWLDEYSKELKDIIKGNFKCDSQKSKMGEHCDETWICNGVEGELNYREAQIMQQVLFLWNRMSELSEMYEEDTRELWLPTGYYYMIRE